MTTDFEISLFHRPGTLAAASAALGNAGIDTEGQCAYVCEGHGVYHVLVTDAEGGRRALIDAGFDILAERRIVVTPLEDRPGAAAAILGRIADQGLSIDLAYTTASGQLAIGGEDPSAIARILSD